jgi:hypothetical protein
MSKDHVLNIARREMLRMLGLGVAGTAVGAVVASDRVFATQFGGDVYPVKVPEMKYDPDLQMMVDPVTRRPIHLDQKVATLDTTITSGDGGSPRCDDHCEQYK